MFSIFVSPFWVILCHPKKEKILFRREIYKTSLLQFYVNAGVDWNYPDQDGGPGNIGSVFNPLRNGLVQVRSPFCF